MSKQSAKSPPPALLIGLVLLLTGLALRQYPVRREDAASGTSSALRTPQESESAATRSDSVVAASTDKHPLATAPLLPGKGMISLTLQFKNGQLVETHREATPGASSRSLRRLEGQPGLYHRILSPTGDVLFENLVPDPRRVPWDTSDDGKTLRGGVAHLEDLPVQIRLPADVHGRLQVFEIINPNWTRSDLDKSGRIVTDLTL